MVSKKPLALLVTGCTLAAVAAPALADAGSSSVGVSFVTADTTRQFSVTKVDGTALNDFTFGSDLAQPFRTTVRDVNRLLNSNGYQVSATMTNLYLKTATGHDFTTFIPSRDLGLSFASPLTGTAHLPISPRVLLTGALGTCADADVAAALGFASVSALTTALLGLLTPALTIVQNVCTQLATAPAVNTIATAASQLVDLAASTAAGLANLPFALTGSLQGGTFANPSYAGVGAGDPSPTNLVPTSKLIMKGTSLLGTGADLTGLLASLTTQLGTQLGGLPLLSSTGAPALLTLAQAESALSSVQPLLNNALSALPAAQATTLLNKLTATLQAVTGLDLSSVTDASDGYPVLTAAPVASKAGQYDGTMVVDFIETGS
jgi:hypothetical protein